MLLGLRKGCGRRWPVSPWHGRLPLSVASTSSLSISEEQAFHLSVFSGGGWSGSGDARFEGEYQSMRSAPCASAPSHPLHAMPSRITRNSYRPRAPIAASFKLDGIATISRESSREWITKAKRLQGNQTRVGWISRKPSRSGRGGSFFLTSLFIELIDSPARPPR